MSSKKIYEKVIDLFIYLEFNYQFVYELVCQHKNKLSFDFAIQSGYLVDTASMLL